ncbi:MAG: 4a-hydroxytetrahydrobiopterin dehydratase [Candidatus Dojkabacteria bacterium]|nr:4a-hydroxytetrahydrobiopterin dehydratase [Candidatus Dojkabacteria bacterium]
MKYPSDWEENSNKLEKVDEFKNFVQAIKFVNKIVPIAEEAKHHPDIKIFEYKKVKIMLTTHDKGNNITKKDIQLANEIDKI